MKKFKLGVTMLAMMMAMMGFTTLRTPVNESSESYTQEDINWDAVTEACISEGISMDFGISKEECSQEFINKISSGSFTEDEIYSYFCSNFPEYPTLVVETLGNNVVIAK